MPDGSKKASVPQILLVGGGHAHALVLRAFARRRLANARVTLVSEAPRLVYSGMLPGHLAGDYERADIEIDLERLCLAAGVDFIVGKVTGLDASRRVVEIAGRGAMNYDFCSLNVGGMPRVDVPGGDGAVPAKPLPALLAEIEKLQGRVLVVGTGAGGVDLTLALSRRFGPRVALTLLGRDAELMPTFPAAARRLLRRRLEERGVKLRLGLAATAVEGKSLRLADGSSLSFDHLLWVTEVRAPSWLESSTLARTAEGFVRVDEQLRSPSHPEVFAVGDVAVIDHHERARAGVFAVRAAGPLEANLRAAVSNAGLVSYVPQKTYLTLIKTGDHEALAIKGRFVAHGRWLHLLKDRIDRAFVAQFRQ